MNLKVIFQPKGTNKKHVTGTLGKRWLRGFCRSSLLVCLSVVIDLSYAKYPFLRPGKLMNGTTTQAANYS